MNPLVDEVCPRPGENKVCTWRFYVGVGVTGHDVIVSRVIAGIIANDEVTTCIDIYSTVVLGTHVAVDPIDPACGSLLLSIGLIVAAGTETKTRA